MSFGRFFHICASNSALACGGGPAGCGGHLARPAGQVVARGGARPAPLIVNDRVLAARTGCGGPPQEWEAAADDRCIGLISHIGQMTSSSLMDTLA